ncbi:MAG: hypothetical protein NTV21_08840 [Planctomycetota bacterium]|nr:hypothetical protein [Planctomycetota bacterium]
MLPLADRTGRVEFAELHREAVAVQEPSCGRQLLVWPGRGDGGFDAAKQVTTAASTGLVADLDSDGKIELVLDDFWSSRPLILWQD